MSELAIDTHRFVKRLMESGFTEPQAETLADAQMAFLESRLATKDELRGVKDELSDAISELRTELKTEIAELRTELKTEIAELRTELKTEIAELRTEMRTEIAAMHARIDNLEHQFRGMLIRSQIALGATIITILTFIDYLTP